jgi:transcriptional regulator with XRE-family HTH domain
MSDPALPRILLATQFPEQFIRDTIIPGLRAIGADVTRLVGTNFDGPIDRDRYDAVAFMFQMCSHQHYDAFKARAKTAGVPFVLVSRKSVEWVTSFRMAGVKLPAVRSGSTTPLPRPAPIVSEPPPPPRPVYASFGAALRAERSAEEVTQSFIADLCGVSSALVGAWEADRQAIALDCYEKLTELFPSLADAPAPEIARKAGHRGPLTPRREDPQPMPLKLPVAPPTFVTVAKPNGHPIASPWVALLQAARALGVAGEASMSFTERAAEVKIGAETWTGDTPEEACQAARAALDGRLSALVARLTEARQLLALGSAS